MPMSLIGDSCINKHVYLVGSSPERYHNLYELSMTTVCVNGSIANLPESCKGVCDILLVDNELLNAGTRIQKRSRSSVHTHFLKNDYKAQILISCQSNGDPGGDPKDLGVNFKRHIKITKSDRLKIISEISREQLLDYKLNSLLSTGGYAIALLFYFGAASITLTGFGMYQSLEAEDPPHFYDDETFPRQDFRQETTTGRNHSLADSYLISRLTIFGYPIFTEHVEYMPLLHNWGYRQKNDNAPTAEQI